MTHLNDTGTLRVGADEIEYRMIGPRPHAAPTLVLLHEGLGSAGAWGDFPERLGEATRAGIFLYSRPGYGRSSPTRLPRPATYMHDEADRLVAVLAAIGFRRGALVGHSDGASIATLYLGRHQDHRIRGVTLIAPHFVVEEMNLAAIAEVGEAYREGGLRQRLSRHHADVDAAFNGWRDAWLSPEFRSWDISDALGYIRVPVQVVQGEADPYGSPRQPAIAEEECYCPVEMTMLPGIGHAPHREATDEVVATIAAFVNRIFDDHGERELAAAA